MKGKVLLVEDDELFASLVKDKLEKAGYKFIWAKDGKETFEILEKTIPDAILLDILLPGGMDGFEILEKVKENYDLKNIPVIILSNFGSLKEIQRGMSLGAYRYLVKASVLPSDIVSSVKSAITSTVK